MLNELDSYSSSLWTLFSKKEFISTIVKYNNTLVPGPDKLLWEHFKYIIKDKTYLNNIIAITNACFKIGY